MAYEEYFPECCYGSTEPVRPIVPNVAEKIDYPKFPLFIIFPL